MTGRLNQWDRTVFTKQTAYTNPIKNVVVAALFFGLTGCVMAPGMQMDDPPPNVPGVEIEPITAVLIREQEVARAKAERVDKSRNPNLGRNYEYRIGPRDVLSIIVWDHPELTLPAGDFRTAESAGHLVAPDGTIFYPYAGQLQVAGKTVSQVRDELTQRMSRAIVDPQLDVKVVAFRSQKAYVSGEVTNPGVLPITDVPLTLVDIIQQAGGITPEADMHSVSLTQGGETYNIDLWALYKRGDVSQNVLLRDGDLVHIPDQSERKVFVMGEVANPSSLLMDDRHMTLTEAISDAGGVDRNTSNPEFIYVIRGTPAEPQIFYLDAESPDALILGEQFHLQPRDVVYVETAAITRWDRVIEQLIPTIIGIDISPN